MLSAVRLYGRVKKALLILVKQISGFTTSSASTPDSIRRFFRLLPAGMVSMKSLSQKSSDNDFMETEREMTKSHSHMIRSRIQSPSGLAAFRDAVGIVLEVLEPVKAAAWDWFKRLSGRSR